MTNIEQLQKAVDDVSKELENWKAEVLAYKRLVVEHAEFGGLFQPDGRFHKIANLRIGQSCVVEGGKWLVAEYDRLKAKCGETV